MTVMTDLTPVAITPLYAFLIGYSVKCGNPVTLPITVSDILQGAGGPEFVARANKEAEGFTDMHNTTKGFLMPIKNPLFVPSPHLCLPKHLNTSTTTNTYD